MVPSNRTPMQKVKIIREKEGALRSSESEKEDLITSLPWRVLPRYALYLKKNNDKYPPGNWKLGMSIERYERGLTRHLQKYIANKYEGTMIEPEVDHLMGILFNVFGIAFEEEKKLAGRNDGKSKKRTKPI